MIAAPVSATHPVTAPIRPLVTVEEQQALIMDRMNADATFERIKVLAAEPRVWKTPGHAKAVDYVAGYMRSLGWDVEVTEQKSGGMFGSGIVRNVVAKRHGTAADGVRKLVVAGAHLDSVSRAPGADDNASGSATLMELAKAFEGIETANDLEFVWFDGEEAGLLGSRAFVAANTEDLQRAVVMLNMDMVGAPNGNVGVSLGARTANAVGDAMQGVINNTGLKAIVRDERHTRSDHASFDRIGVPALDFGVSVKGVAKEDPYYHSPQDSIDKINKTVLEGFGDLIGATLLDFANRSERIPGPAPVGEPINHGKPKSSYSPYSQYVSYAGL